MAIAASYSNFFNGDYARAIQLALGNGGATATIITSKDGNSLQISGTPTGAGLKIKAKEAASTSAVKDTVSLSPAAQVELETQLIALHLLTAKNVSLPSKKADDLETSQQISSVLASKGAATPSGTVDNGSISVSATDVTALAQQNPTQVIKDAVSAAQATIASISTTSGFSHAAASDPSFLATFLNGFSNDDTTAIKAALANNTLSVQSAVNAQYGGTKKLIIGGTFESISLDLSSNSEGHAPTPGTKQIIVGWGGFGNLAISFPT